MSYWIYTAGNRNNSLWRFFMCDSISDLKNLPTATKEGQPQPNDTVCKNKCCPGSQCFCLENGSSWILGKDSDKWIQNSNKNTSISEFIQSDEPDVEEGAYWLQGY